MVKKVTKSFWDSLSSSDRKVMFKYYKKSNKKKTKKTNKEKTYNNFTENYKEFLNSKYWKKCVLIVLKRDNFECVRCESKKELNVHHITYKNHFNEINHLDDLITLCRNCHEEHHKIRKYSLSWI